jgi:hypothetical protein
MPNRRITPEEADALGIPRREYVVYSPHAGRHSAPPRPATPSTPTGPPAPSGSTPIGPDELEDEDRAELDAQRKHRESQRRPRPVTPS